MTRQSVDTHERIGLAGSGAIACGLAAVAADHGEVVVWARSEDSAGRALGLLNGASAAIVTTDLDALAGASFVVEAIAEDLGAKSALLADLDTRLPEEVILASTTSSLSVAALAKASGRPDRFAALHVFNPVQKMVLVEIAFAPEASEETRERTRGLCHALGKTPVEVSDTPGFVVNRLLLPYLFDAVELLERTGMDAGDLDCCMTLGAGHPMGPLRLLDLVGLDVAVAIGDGLGIPAPARVRALVADGALGRKAGRGFFTYG